MQYHTRRSWLAQAARRAADKGRATVRLSEARRATRAQELPASRAQVDAVTRGMRGALPQPRAAAQLAARAPPDGRAAARRAAPPCPSRPAVEARVLMCFHVVLP